ncbi:hypothetical protein ACFUJR_12060 [Streptomyces sp. NPDC057271]|uniref:hypothetical protein n=1 Tax=unclassified Streptomyces TaxID=2593676 RepID=UPI003625908E
MGLVLGTAASPALASGGEVQASACAKWGPTIQFDPISREVIAYGSSSCDFSLTIRHDKTFQSDPVLSRGYFSANQGGSVSFQCQSSGGSDGNVYAIVTDASGSAETSRISVSNCL